MADKPKKLTPKVPKVRPPKPPKAPRVRPPKVPKVPKP